MKYFNNLNEEVKDYFNILSPEYPDWLNDYINTDEMQRISKISLNCGTDYSKCFNINYFYSNLEHSIGVALIIWNFTHDKKQTLSGLFHDISTPVFKHCIDFMNKDYEKQESTEERTTDFIKKSDKIMRLLKRDCISLKEVENYKLYPIADNDTPKLSSDRFEYNFSSGLSFFRVWELNKIKEVYNNIIISKNEEGIDELTFKDKEICEKYISTISKLWPEWISDKDRTVMQFLADICKTMINMGYLITDELYALSEKEIIDKILNCRNKYISESFQKFLNADTVYKSETFIQNKYCVNVKPKLRYVNPLVKTNNQSVRIDKISKPAKELIEQYLNSSKGNWTYFDFDFKPVELVKQRTK